MRRTALLAMAAVLAWPQDIDRSYGPKPRKVAQKHIASRDSREPARNVTVSEFKFEVPGHALAAETGKVLEAASDQFALEVPAGGPAIRVQVVALNETHVHQSDQVALADASGKIAFSPGRSFHLVEKTFGMQVDGQASWVLPPNLLKVNLVADGGEESKVGTAALSDQDFVVQVRIAGKDFDRLLADGELPPCSFWTEREHLVPRYTIWVSGERQATLVAVLPRSSQAQRLVALVGTEAVTAALPAPVSLEVPAQAQGTVKISAPGARDALLIHGPLKPPFEAKVEPPGPGPWTVAVQQDMFAMLRLRPVMNWSRAEFTSPGAAAVPEGQLLPGLPVRVIAFSPELHSVMSDVGPWIGGAADLGLLAFLNKMKPITDLAQTVNNIYGGQSGGGQAGRGAGATPGLTPVLWNVRDGKSPGGTSHSGPTSGGWVFVGTGNQQSEKPDPYPEPLPQISVRFPPEIRFEFCYITCECGRPQAGIGFWKHTGDGCKPCRPKAKAWQTVQMSIDLNNGDRGQFYFKPVRSEDGVVQLGASHQVIDLKRGENGPFKLMVTFAPPGPGKYEYFLEVKWTDEEWDKSNWEKDKDGKEIPPPPDRWRKKPVARSVTVRVVGIVGVCQWNPLQPYVPEGPYREYAGCPGGTLPQLEGGSLLLPTGGVVYYKVTGEQEKEDQIYAMQVDPGGQAPMTPPSAQILAVATSGLLFDMAKPSGSKGGAVAWMGSTDVTQKPELFVMEGRTPVVTSYHSQGFEHAAIASDTRIHLPDQELVVVTDGVGRKVGSAATFSGIEPGELGKLNLETYDSKGELVGRSNLPGGGYDATLRARFDRDSYPANSPLTFTVENLGNYLKAMRRYLRDAETPRWLELLDQNNVQLPARVPLGDVLSGKVNKLTIPGRSGPQAGNGSVRIGFSK